MHITPAILRATYDWLRTTPPLRRWKLPDGDDVRFRVTRNRNEYASVERDGDGWTINVSHLKVGHTDTLIKAMLHEMAHMRTELAGNGMTHGRAWTNLVRSICRHHGYDHRDL